ncbi:hypothetical protein [Olsenella uli]|uniref:hypothetical protein n=1 Tax=Olsenella uli TaxID=133926 RepID=UPI0028EF8E6C|nr:hypothetical protein [Olsenella uli]
MNVDDYRRMRLALEDRLWGNRESRERAEQGNEILEMTGRDMRAWSDEFAYLTRGIPDMDANVAELQDGVNRSMLDIAYGCDERLQELDAERRSIEDHMESLDGEFARWARDEREAGGTPGAPDAGWRGNPGWGGGRYDR